MLLDEYPLLTVSPESSSYPLCITVAAYSSSSTGAPPERTFFEYLCLFLCLQVNFRERCKGEVRRIPVPGTGVKIVSAVALFHSFGVARQGPWITRVNKDRSKDRSSYPYSAGRYLLHGSNTPQCCLKRSATASGERLPLGSALVDGGLCLRKPPNVRPVSVHYVGFVAAFDSTSPPWPQRFTFVAPTMGARLLSPRARLLPLAAARSSVRWWRIPSSFSPSSRGCS